LFVEGIAGDAVELFEIHELLLSVTSYSIVGYVFFRLVLLLATLSVAGTG
jgi:hypothetical protein